MRKSSSTIIGSLLLLLVGGFIALLLTWLAEDTPSNETNDLLFALLALVFLVISSLGFILLVWLAMHRRKSFFVALAALGLVFILGFYLYNLPPQAEIESWEQIEARDFAYAEEQGWTTLISTNALGEQRFYRKENNQWVRKESELELAYKPCEQPIPYTIASIDHRFGISEEKLLSLAKEVEDVWEKAVGLDLLVYQEDSGIIKINMIFDERQERALAELESIKRLETGWESYNNLFATHDVNVLLYNEDVQKYDKAVVEFNARNDAYAKRVQQWNENPTTEEEYNYLMQEHQAINALSAELSVWNDTINARVSDLNKKEAELNALWKQLDLKTYAHNEEFTEGETTSGEYGGYSIEVYTFYNMPGLRQTLAHEFGHALGIGHLSNPSSVMHRLMGGQNMFSLTPSDEDLAELSSICGVN